MGEVYAQYISSLYALVVKMKKKADIEDVVDETCDDLKNVRDAPLTRRFAIR